MLVVLVVVVVVDCTRLTVAPMIDDRQAKPGRQRPAALWLLPSFEEPNKANWNYAPP